MSDDVYRVVFKGLVASGHDMAAVRVAVGRLLRCDDSALIRLFSGEPVVIKGNLDQATAQKCRRTFEKTGALCQIEIVSGLSIIPAGAIADSMTCPKCRLEQAQADSCTGCGIYVDKYRQRQATLQAFPPIDSDTANEVSSEEVADALDENLPLRLRDNPGRYLKTLALPPAVETNPVILAVKALILLVLIIWGGRFAFASISSNYAGESILHLINLPFHEAGHIFFRPLGRFMTSAGGSITQILVPLICLGVLLVQTRDAFGAGVCLWWTGQNFLDLAPYIDDAQAGVMPLIGGNTGRTSPYGFHDWEFLLTETGLLRYDHALARLAHIFGCLVMVVGIIWSGLVLYRHFRAGQKESVDSC